MNIIEKIKKVEALIERAGSEGEKIAALKAKERLEKHTLIEYTIHTQDMWHKKLFTALCRKYNLKPYRYYRQKYTTVMIKINKNFLNNILWKEYLKYSEILEKLIQNVTDEIISKIHKDEEEIVVSKDIE